MVNCSLENFGFVTRKIRLEGNPLKSCEISNFSSLMYSIVSAKRFFTLHAEKYQKPLYATGINKSKEMII